jgi:hypothetical protein
MPATFEDPQLGSLSRRRGRWRGEIDLVGGRVALAVVGPRREPDPDALAIARRVGDELESARPEVEVALADHREPSGEQAQGWMVEWASVAPLDGALTLELGLDVAWDEEHTLGARIRDGRLVELNGSVLRP